MRIDSSGNIGIGINSPSNKLVVNSPAHDDGLYVLAGNNNQSTRIRIQGKSSSGTEHNWNLDVARSADRFGISNGVNTHLAILDAGNIGMGVTSPNTKLHIIQQTVNASTLSTTTSKQLGLWIQSTGGSNTTGHIETGIAFSEGYAGIYSIDAGSGAATSWFCFWCYRTSNYRYVWKRRNYRFSYRR